MGDEDERVAIQTYVPASQRDIWRDEADSLDMSQAEYVRSMVQAGRRSFTLDSIARNPQEPHSPDVTPGVDGLNDRVLEILREHSFPSWNQVLEALTGHIEEDLEDALEELQESNLIKYSGRHDGYTVIDDGR